MFENEFSKMALPWHHFGVTFLNDSLHKFWHEFTNELVMTLVYVW